MKNFLLIGFLFFFFSEYAQEEGIKTESKIEAVTVYFNQAEISRVANTKLSPGKQILRFTGLSQHLDPASLQVSGKGSFTILSVRHRINFLDEHKSDEQLEALRNKVKEIQDQLADNNALLSVYSSEEALLNENRKIGGSQTGVDVAGLKEAAAFYRTRMIEIKKKQLALQRANAKLNKEYQKYQGQLNALLSPDQEPSSEVLVSIEAPREVPNAIFTLQYVVDHASWFPSYDIRGNGLNEPLKLDWKANISQQTGVDWKDVALTVSTGNPSLGGVKPELDKWYLELRNGYPYSYHSGLIKNNRGEVEGYVFDASTGEAIPYASVQVSESTIGTFTDVRGHFKLVIPRNARYLEFSSIGYEKSRLPVQNTLMRVYLQQQRNSLEEIKIYSDQNIEPRKRSLMAPPMSHTTNTAMGKSEDSKAKSLPVAGRPEVQQNAATVSRNFVVKERYNIRNEGAPTTITISRRSLPARFVHYAVPKIDNDAFLTAEITGWDTLNLLAGEANLYFEDAFVGKTVIDPSTTGDTLSLSLGRDPSVVIKREKIRDFNKKRLLGNKKIQSIGWEISIRNNKEQAIHIVIQDQIPVSRNSEIIVSTEETDRGRIDPDSGHLQWELDIPAGSSKILRFRYTVKYPKNGEILME